MEDYLEEKNGYRRDGDFLSADFERALGKRGVTLEEFADFAQKKEGLNLAKVNPGDLIVIETRNSIYLFEVITPFKGKEALIEESCTGQLTGGIIKENQEVVGAILRGAIAGRSMINVGWIRRDMSVEFGIPREEYRKLRLQFPPKALEVKSWPLITSPVQNLSLLQLGKSTDT